jgi:alanine-glyoxylate transaminase/serine-glyoxylate transaminase/serine-pyruvate transaminase
MGSLMQTGDRILVASNGFFGQRLCNMAGAYGLDVRLDEGPLTLPLDPDQIRRRLAAERGIEAIVLVHLETSTGVLNPVQDIAAVANEFEVPLILDAVSSLGGVPLPVDAWGIDVCATVANKCLACPPGVAPISISQRAWEQIERKPDRSHGWYLNLEVWRDYADRWGFWHPSPTTLPTNNIIALRVGLQRILDIGLEAHYDRHVQAARTVRAGLARSGFELFTEEAYSSPLITAVHGLPGMDIADFRRYLIDEWQVMISGGLEELRGQIFRVGHIGKAVSEEYTARFLEGVEAYLRLRSFQAHPREDNV